ncbi:MAG: Gfo/Idh/MocA family oxidoreductase [Planctomycetota bacterium]
MTEAAPGREESRLGTGLRAGIIGARRVAQGLGPFIARDLAAAGIQIAAVLGRTPETAAEAASAVAAASGGVPPLAASDGNAFFAAGLDLVCVLSPAGTHGEWVDAALRHGCHVLAEKPFLWFPEPDWSSRAAALETRFAEKGLVLAVNAQWPWTLPSLEEALGRSIRGTRKLAMGMQPASSGLRMIGDAAPHPLSVAQALVPGLTDFAELQVTLPSDGEIVVSGVLAGETAALEIEMHLDGRPLVSSDGTPAGPRSAWIALDDDRVDRCIRPRDYALFFRRGSGLFDLPDPLGLRLTAFVEAVLGARQSAGALEPDRTISRRAAMLESIAAAFGHCE